MDSVTLKLITKENDLGLSLKQQINLQKQPKEETKQPTGNDKEKIYC